MKKLVLISALVLFVAGFSYAAHSSIPEATPVEVADDDPKAKEEKSEKKDKSCCAEDCEKSCCKKEDKSCSKEAE